MEAFMSIVLVVGFIALVVTCFSIEKKFDKTFEQNSEIINLLKQIKDNK
ncbi:hypothetical protein ACFSCX_15965 [Bacillus salitolerans]|uniref:Uncharacterized protein n=1 Tax=Bacillus salitolerans TaxID=1437434 RepID=A0ABW4LSI0_9BACI